MHAAEGLGAPLPVQFTLKHPNHFFYSNLCQSYAHNLLPLFNLTAFQSLQSHPEHNIPNLRFQKTFNI